MTYPDRHSNTPAGPPVRIIYHAAPLTPHNHPITCPGCQADRNWLLIQRPHTTGVMLRCRCAHEWIDPEVDLEFFESMYIYPEQDFDSADDIIQSTGFDGTFAGSYF